MTASSIAGLPSALERFEEIERSLAGREPALFLDYDGTLTPIVRDPAEAILPGETREAIRRLRDVAAVAVISGRDLDDVRAMVEVDGIAYAGSHGFDILDPSGERHAKGEKHLPALDEAQERLQRALASLPGGWIERKRFAVAIHFREVDPERVPAVEAAVDRVMEETEGLRKTSGKRIFELRPDVEWDKGRAVRWLLEVLGLDRDDVVPFYLGDDLTDEDAFEAIEEDGVGIVVQGEDRERTTRARYALADPDAVRRFLKGIARERSEEEGAETEGGE